MARYWVASEAGRAFVLQPPYMLCSPAAVKSDPGGAVDGGQVEPMWFPSVAGDTSSLVHLPVEDIEGWVTVTAE